MIVCGVCLLFVCLFVCCRNAPPHDFSEWLKILNFCLYSHLFVFLFAQPYFTLNSSPLTVKAVLHRGLLLAQR